MTIFVADVFHAGRPPRRSSSLAVTVRPQRSAQVRDIQQVVIHHPLIVRVVTVAITTPFFALADEFPARFC